MQIRTFWKAREQTRKTMLIFAHQPQYSVIFVGRKLGRFGVPGFCVVCLLCLSTRPWGGPPRSGASQGLGIGNIMLVMQGKPNFQRITGATCAPPRPHRPPPGLILIHPVDVAILVQSLMLPSWAELCQTNHSSRPALVWRFTAS